MIKKILKKVEFVLKCLFRNRFVIRIICLFVPNKQLRKKIRKKTTYLYDKKKIDYRKIKKIQNEKLSFIVDLQEKRKIKVVFFILSNIGKQDNVLVNIYKQFKDDKKFDCTLVIAPYVYLSKYYAKSTSKQSFEYLKSKGFKVVNGYDVARDSFIDIKKAIKPDVTFFMEQTEYLCDPKHQIKYYYDTICYMTPYSYSIALGYEYHFNMPAHKIAWKIFGESMIHKKMAKKYCDFGDFNFIGNLGYAKVDAFLDKSYRPKFNWKRQNKEKKKIIIAPHHYASNYPNFKIYHQFFLDIAKWYEDKIQFVFRPHPVLKETLYKEKDWGKGKADNYFVQWDIMQNTQTEFGEYRDLFLTSDAMILDSVSFMQEYLFTGKPLLVLRKETNSENFNTFGEEVLNQHYVSRNEEDIINFIENQVLKGNDYMKQQREKFVEKYMTPQNGKTASENIYEYVKNELNKD